jgi:RES domain-containing protein
MRVWRICREKYAASAFSGEGARLFAGRWNPRGVAMVYCSTSLALAALELFVHLDPSVAPEDLVATAAEVPGDLESIPRRNIGDLPAGWRATENLALREMGTAWVESGESMALLVPSAIIDEGWNVLLNPAHADFALIRTEPPKPFHFDARMFLRCAALGPKAE